MEGRREGKNQWREGEKRKREEGGVGGRERKDGWREEAGQEGGIQMEDSRKRGVRLEKKQHGQYQHRIAPSKSGVTRTF